MEKEKWKYIYEKGIITIYMISSHGNVKNSKTGRILKLQEDKDGYLTVHLHAIHRHKKVHRLVAEAFIDNPENKPEVNHKTGNKKNNYYKKLEWATGKENIDHAHETGLTKSCPGEDNGYSKYKESNIRKVCELLETCKYTRKEISKLTGVSKYVIKHILNLEGWTHISKDYVIDKPRNRKMKKDIIKLLLLDYTDNDILKELKLPNKKKYIKFIETIKDDNRKAFNDYRKCGIFIRQK